MSTKSATDTVDPRLDQVAVARLLTRIVAAPEASTQPARSPFGALLAHVPQSTPDDVVLAVTEARAAQHRWAARSV